MDRGSIRQSRPRVSSTKSETTANLSEPVKVARNGSADDQQLKRLQNSAAAAELGSSTKKLTRRSRFKHTDYLEESDSGAAENTIKEDVVSIEGHPVHSDPDAPVVCTERPTAVKLLPHTLALDSGSTSNVRMDEANIQPHVIDGQLSCSISGEVESQSEVPKSFQTPGLPRRARSIASPGMTFASIRKTPKNLRNSLLLRGLSPEEG